MWRFAQRLLGDLLMIVTVILLSVSAVAFVANGTWHIIICIAAAMVAVSRSAMGMKKNDDVRGWGSCCWNRTRLRFLLLVIYLILVAASVALLVYGYGSSPK